MTDTKLTEKENLLVTKAYGKPLSKKDRKLLAKEIRSEETPPTSEDWQKEFNEKFVNSGLYSYVDLKQFVSSTRQQAVEEYREKILELPSIKWGTSEHVDLNEVLSLLSKGKE